MDRPGKWDTETAGDALAVLEDLALWIVTPGRWERIDGLLARMQDALSTGDPAGLAGIVAQLELCAPSRITPIGADGARGIPEPVLERQNRLVHALTPDRGADRPDGPRTGAGRGDQPAR
ncbi:CATRA system-associated protein [Actinoplanes sp. NPDC023714]|uniref:CATRA system-associated protein n=1 Tax=Actinoplanes sp. NPDC023714 TaxID=3154322 RepID=UPI0033E8DF59